MVSFSHCTEATAVDAEPLVETAAKFAQKTTIPHNGYKQPAQPQEGLVLVECSLAVQTQHTESCSKDTDHTGSCPQLYDAPPSHLRRPLLQVTAKL